MKKVLKPLVLALAAALTLTACLGPKAPETAKDLIANAKIQMDKKKSMTSQTQMVLSIGLMDQEVKVTTEASSKEVFKDKASETKSTTTIETSLEGGPSSPIEVQTYILGDPDQGDLLDVYSKSQGQDWDHQIMSLASISSQGTAFAPKDMVAFIDQYIDKLLLEESQDQEGQKTYVLEGTLPGTELTKMVGNLGAQLDSQKLLPEIQLEVRAVFDGKSQALKSVAVSIPQALMEDETIGPVSLALEMDYQITGYNEVKSIEIPEEALAKAGKTQ